MLKKQTITRITGVLVFSVFTTITACAAEGVASPSVTDVSGTTVDLTRFDADELTIELGDKCTLRLPISLVKTVQGKAPDKLTVTLSTGTEIIGTIGGQISGESDLGRYSLPWSKVKTIAFPEGDRPAFKKPSGLSAQIKMNAGRTLDLSGLLYVYSSSERDHNWIPPKPCVREYTYDYIDLTPVPGVYGYNIPLEWIRSLAPAERGHQFSIELPDGSRHQISGTIGNLHRTTHRHRLQGCDESGVWTVPIESIASLTAHVPVAAYPEEARGVCVFTDYGVFTAKKGSTINDRPYAVHWSSRSVPNGKHTCSVTLESGAQIQITSATLSTLSVKQGESDVRVEWDKIRKVTFATTAADASENAWRKAEVELISGKTLSTTATFSGYLGLSGLTKGGIPTTVRYNKIKALEMLGQK